MSFYGSLPQADAVVLIGGARSTLVMGALALTYRIPMLALKAYGGSAEKVWKAIKGGRSLATDGEANEMAQRGDKDIVARWIASLEREPISISTRRDRRKC